MKLKRALVLMAALVVLLSSLAGRRWRVPAEESEALEFKAQEIGGWKDAPPLAGQGDSVPLNSPISYRTPEFGFASAIVEKIPNLNLEILPDLSNIENIGSFSNLTASQREKISQNGFVAAPTTKGQLFYIYEENEYKSVPSFITSDSVLQLYHVFTSYCIRSTEGDELIPGLKELAGRLLEAFKQASAMPLPEEALEAANELAAYSLVAYRLLEENSDDLENAMRGLPEEAISMSEQELALIYEAGREAMSPVAGHAIDYASFEPQGHYTKTDAFDRYYRAHVWFASALFSLEGEDGFVDVAGSRKALALALALAATDSLSLWEELYSVSAFFFGSSPRLTCLDIYNEMVEAFPNQSMEEILPELYIGDKTQRISIALASLAKSRQAEPSFSLLPSREAPDAAVLSLLSDPELRPLPSGLDIPAAMGSNRAWEHLSALQDPQERWPDFTTQFQNAMNLLMGKPEAQWRADLRHGWLWALAPLLEEEPTEEDQFFMRGSAWTDKQLSAFLSSWTEAMHDTALASKPPSAEMGGWPETAYPGYVEPSIKVYERLSWLTRFTRENLGARGVLGESLRQKALELEELLEFLIQCSIKELSNEPLSEDDQERIVKYGGVLERLSTTIASDDQALSWYQIEPESNRSMALVTEACHQGSQILYEAVGNAAEIYVAVEMDGKLILTRGAVFDWYEFSSSQPLEDDLWQLSLEIAADQGSSGIFIDGGYIRRPSWTSSYMVQEGSPLPAVSYSTFD
jgi:hypothetical protein